MQEEFTIIVLGFERLYSIQRLLYSLVQAGKAWNSNKPIPLIISLDFGNIPEVEHFCSNFFSKYFICSVRLHEKKLGVDEHNLWAMAQSENSQAVMVLEDDMMVSPSLFHYTAAALGFFSNDGNIAGISLYNYMRNEACNYPFWKRMDGNDCYFYQKASSRGLVITKQQWIDFKNIEKEGNIPDLPAQVKRWPNEVWEKKFNTYLVLTGKFWAYPQISYTTNFGEIGVHVKNSIFRHAFQSAMQNGVQTQFKFTHSHKSSAVYDAYGEPAYITGYSNQEITSDIFGIRDLNHIKTKYVLTSRYCTNSVEGYALDLIPAELNIEANLRGHDLMVTEVKYIRENFIQKQRRLLKLHYYFYPDKGLLHLLRLKSLEIINRIRI